MTAQAKEMMTPKTERKHGYTIYNSAAVLQLPKAPERRPPSISPVQVLIAAPVVIPAVLANWTSRALISLVS